MAVASFLKRKSNCLCFDVPEASWYY